MSRVFVVGLLGMFLSGCVGMAEASQNECKSLGLKQGTPEFANCYEQAMMRRQSIINAP